MILEVIFVALIEDSSVLINNTKEPREYLHHQK